MNNNYFPAFENLPEWHRICWLQTDRLGDYLEQTIDQLDPDRRCSAGGTPLHYAAASDRDAAGPGIELLLERGMVMSVRDRAGAVPLHWACRWGSPDTVRLLIERMVEQQNDLPVDDLGRTCLHWYAMGEPVDWREAIIGDLVAAGCGFDTPDRYGATSLHWAAATVGCPGHVLARAPWLVNVRDQAGGTPVIWLAATGGPVWFGIDDLVRHGVDLDASSNDGTTATSAVPARWQSEWQMLCNHLRGNTVQPLSPAP